VSVKSNWLNQLAWLPIPLLLAAIIVAWAAGLRGSYEAHTLLLVLSFTFYTLVSLSTLYLIGRSFLASGLPGLLLLECGVVLWSLAGTIGDFVSHGDANINVTIFNAGILLAGLCHLAGAVLTLWPQRVLRVKPLWLGVGWVFALGLLWLIAQAALLGWLPVFFIPGHGGTPVRYFVLISAIAMFVLSSGVLLASQRETRLPFTSWYALALLLLAVGLFGVMIQLSLGSIVNWLSRAAQWLGGMYLLFAALASLRQSQLPLFPPENKSHPAYYRDAIAVAIVLAATALRLVFLQILGTQAPFVTFYPAVILAALYGGRRAGLVATVLSAIVVHYFWIEPTYQFAVGQPGDWLALVIFLLSGSMIAWVTDTMHSARTRAFASEALHKSLDELEARVQERTQGLKEAEAAMRLANAYNRGLLEVSLDPLVTISAEGKITDVNRATEAATGCSRTALIGTDFCDYFTEPEKARTGYEQVFREGSVRDYALELRHRDGTVSPVLYNASVYHDDQGTVIGVFATARDITEQKQAQKALKELNVSLEQHVIERTTELQAANKRLRASRLAALNLMEDALQSRKESEKASEELHRVNKELESFVYSVSHDLRAPLRSMAGFAKIVNEDYAQLLNEKGKDYLSRIYNSAERMNRLIDDLLHLSRISKQDLAHTTQIDLSKLASLSITELQQGEPDRSVAVNIQNGLFASVDQRLIALALTNLLENAWKFTKKTQDARIEFGAHTRGKKIIYYVRDNGAGFDPAYEKKMFLPFHRLHSEQEFEGTGIGLAIVERVIRRHGGKVWAEGKVNKGATFYFTLG